MRRISEAKGSRWSQSIDWSAASFHSRRRRDAVALRVLDQLRAGVIVTDNGGQIIEINRAAKFIVQFDDGLNIRNGQLCARRAFESAKMAKLIAGATADAAARRMLVGRCDGLPPYMLNVAPLRTDMAVDDRQLVLIVVVDPQRHSPLGEEFADLFGLSPAEARLAAALLSGKMLSQISACTGVRITTLRTQLGSILRKVGAHRQSDLIRILSSTGIGTVSLSAGWLNIAEAVTQMPLWLAGV
jgi:DNA-binding CsgD family transcriptional regulator